MPCAVAIMKEVYKETLVCNKISSYGCPTHPPNTDSMISMYSCVVPSTQGGVWSIPRPEVTNGAKFDVMHCWRHY